ncbi:MAG: hypothetical protein DI607_14185, partial [Sphingomonas hengshuiensis]
MPVRNSPYFNSQAIASISSNLAGLFEPPSGTDVAGYATADAKRAEMNRLAQLFDYSQAKDFDQQRFDRMGAATGQWTPSQGYYAVDQGNAAARYGYDRTFEASRLNSADDNARALAERQMQ